MAGESPRLRKGSHTMQNNGKLIDAPGLAIRTTHENPMVENKPAPSGLVEAAIRVLGTALVLYRHYVPNSDYYKVHETNIQ